jgi:hypothetical protein
MSECAVKEIRALKELLSSNPVASTSSTSMPGNTPLTLPCRGHSNPEQRRWPLLGSEHRTNSIPGTVAISDDDMRRFAPSVFASQPIEEVFGKVQFFFWDPGSKSVASCPEIARKLGVAVDSARYTQNRLIKKASILIASNNSRKGI